jgi:hypothetical protein
MPKLPTLGGPAPEQPQDISCESLNAEKARLLAQRDDLNAPFLSSRTQAQRDAELTQLNGKLYTVAKAQFDMQCPTVAKWVGGFGCAVVLSLAASCHL